MLTGRRAFAGEDVSDTLATVLKNDPDWNALPAATLPAIRTLLARCLQRDRKRRLPDIAVARLDIDDAIASPPASSAALSARPVRQQRVPWVIAALALATAVTLAAVAVFKRPSASTDVVRFTLSLPDGWTLASAPMPFRLSPDGRRLLVVATDASRRSGLWVRSLDSLAFQELPGTEGATAPFWSPDSRFVAFRADGKLQKIDTLGGGPTALCDVGDLRGGTWSKRGLIVFATGQGLKKVSESGGTAESIALTGLSPSFPIFLPDDRHFLYRTFGGIFAGSLDGTGVTQILNNSDAANVAYAAGRLFFVRGGALMAQAFDPDRLKLSGEPRLVADSIQPFTPTRSYQYSVSDGGTFVYQTGVAGATTQLVLLDRTGRQLSAIGELADYSDVSLAPDGKRAAVTLADPSRGTSNIWIVDVTIGTRTQFTFDSAEDQAPIWSEDGTRIAYGSRRNDRWGIYQKASNGAGAEEVVAQFPLGMLGTHPLGWTQDNRSMLFVSGNATAGALSVLPLVGDRKPMPYLVAGRAGPGQLSTDNRWVVHFSAESGRNEVYVTPYPSRPGQWRVSPDGGTQARWRRSDGKEIYFINRNLTIMAADVSADGDAFQVNAVRPLFSIRSSRLRYTYDVSADGQRFLVLTQAAQETAPHPLTFVLNWLATSSK
jgi:Tol biopolymer transport system component